MQVSAPVKLGERKLDGETVAGSRVEATIPAGAIGNEQPIRMSAEQWYGRRFQVVVEATYRDPRTGETRYKLVKSIAPSRTRSCSRCRTTTRASRRRRRRGAALATNDHVSNRWAVSALKVTIVLWENRHGRSIDRAAIRIGCDRVRADLAGISAGRTDAKYREKLERQHQIVESYRLTYGRLPNPKELFAYRAIVIPDKAERFKLQVDGWGRCMTACLCGNRFILLSLGPNGIYDGGGVDDLSIEIE